MTNQPGNGGDRMAREVETLRRRVVELEAAALGSPELEAGGDEGEQLFRKIFDEGPLGMAIVDRDFRLRRVNAMLCRMLGRTPEQLVGRTFAGITHPDDVDADLQRAEALFAGRIPFYQLDKRYLRSDGEVVFARLTASVIRQRGAPVYGLGMVEDATERRRAQQHGRRLEAELAHLGRVATMGEMAAALAHELNQPLTAIRTYAEGSLETLRSDEMSSGDAVEALERVRGLADRARAIVQRIRNLVRRSEPQRNAVDVNELVDEVVALEEADARHRGLVVRAVLAAGLPPVHADRIQVQQVVINLVRNALEAMEQTSGSGHEVTIRTGRRGTGRIRIAVADRGPGLPASAATRIFEPFVTTKPRGLGMGLAISRTIVEAHGGRLVAEPRRGGGMVFRFTLPPAPEETG